MTSAGSVSRKIVNCVYIFTYLFSRAASANQPGDISQGLPHSDITTENVTARTSGLNRNIRRFHAGVEKLHRSKRLQVNPRETSTVTKKITVYSVLYAWVCLALAAVVRDFRH